MIPWIQVYSNLITHPKTSKLADLLKLSSKATVPNVVATGLLISLWTWAVQNAYSGDLSGCSDRAIADAARYRQNPQGFVNALTEAGCPFFAISVRSRCDLVANDTKFCSFAIVLYTTKKTVLIMYRPLGKEF